jgi:hypothetical protein
MGDNEHTKMGQWQLPALVGFKADNEVPVLIRAVTKEEMVRLHEITKRVSNLRSRFSLFATSTCRRFCGTRIREAFLLCGRCVLAAALRLLTVPARQG